MRKEKMKELRIYINELQVKKMKLVKRENQFLSMESYACQILDKTVKREKLLKQNGNGNACVILPITENGNILLVVQPRVFTKRGVCVELPAGYVDAGESYEEAAKRELLEETGYSAGNLELLASFYQDQGCMSAFNKSFLASNCQKVGEQRLDSDEMIRYFECSFDEALELVDRGFITDAASQLTIERAKQYLKKMKYDTRTVNIGDDKF